MLTKAGNQGTVCATDERAARVEDLQLTTGVGPCIDAVTSGSPVLIADLDRSEGVDLARWASLGDLSTSGVRALFAFPLRIGAITVGALDLYRDTPGELAAEELSVALFAADVAAIALLQLVTATDDVFALDTSRGADYRMQIHQATGMVAVQLGVTVGEALLRLRARAFTDGSSVAELAADVVARRVRFQMEDR
jgi:GAF domain-containing protein